MTKYCIGTKMNTIVFGSLCEQFLMYIGLDYALYASYACCIFIRRSLQNSDKIVVNIIGENATSGIRTSALMIIFL